MLGIYSIVLSVFMVFVTMLNSGMQFAVSKHTTTYYSTNKKHCNAGVSSGLIISLMLCLIISIIIILFKPLFVNYFNNEMGYVLLLTILFNSLNILIGVSHSLLLDENKILFISNLLKNRAGIAPALSYTINY